MGRAVEGPSYEWDPAGDPRRRLVVDDAHRLDASLGVIRQMRFDLVGVDAMAPVTGQKDDVEPELLGELFPQGRKVPGLDHEDAVARRQRVDQRRFPGSRTRRRVHDDRLARLKHLPHPVQDVVRQLAKLRSPVINGGAVPWLRECGPGRSSDLESEGSGGRFGMP